MFAYQTNERYFAQIADGTEEVATGELSELGATEIKPAYRGLYFSAGAEALYRINYAARIPTRIFAPLLNFDCHSTKYLYRRVQEIFWPDLFSVDDTFAVFANVSNSIVRHSQYALLQVKDAIVDQFRAHGGTRPNVSTGQPDLRINLYLHGNRATLSLETSGGSMHKRGYRQQSVDAPMQEHVAAAIIRMTGWDGNEPLYDPMCGSGTLLAEAVMHYCRIPSGLLREKFGLRFLPDFDTILWRRVRSDVDGAMRALPDRLVAGSDV
ncbi:MAG: class I SAM-dependent RNA methyltransferase, partial [Candidatus Krumholzibacteriota bacterium]|nr:class I SAM-dependent RNA methyltransferase [Candidatus Krumholzibacteriota bacterium]